MQINFKHICSITDFKFSIPLFGLLLILTASLNGCYVTRPAPSAVLHTEVLPPAWAPPYQNQSRIQYYYIPDIEVYYDVWNHEFIYLENGNWVFAPGLPPWYSNYDLYGGHVVVLNYHVHEPWRHHEIYSSHYPKYYHHSVHTGNNGEYSTGFDENTNQHYYGPRTTTPSSGGNNQRTNTQPPTSGPRTDSPATNQPRTNPSPKPKEQEARPSIVTPNLKPERQEPPAQPRKAQPVQYKERVVGQPVKVQKNMVRPKPATERKATAAPKPEIKRQ